MKQFYKTYANTVIVSSVMKKLQNTENKKIKITLTSRFELRSLKP